MVNIARRHAEQHVERVLGLLQLNRQLRHRRFGGAQHIFGLVHVAFGGGAAMELGFGDFQRFALSYDVILRDFDLLLGRAELT